MKRNNLKKEDKEVFKIIKKERKRRKDTLEMIPSENHTSPAVLEAMSTILTDKYAEGYPGKRYYGGNEYIDEVEVLAKERAKKLFNVPFANVQPYSGSPANMAVYFACMEPGEKVLGMNLKDGGHLTHGWPVSFSGTYYESASYGVNEKDQRINLEEVRKIAKEEKPKLIWVGGSAYPRDFDWKGFSKIAEEVGAYLAADIAHIAGLIVAGVHSSPAEHVDIITTTTHKTLRGPRGGMVMVTEKGLKKDSELDQKINKAVFPGLQGGPHEHQIAAKAVCFREALGNDFKTYGQKVVNNNKKLAEELINRDFELVTGGTDNHLCLIDLRSKDIGGKKAESLLEKAGITINKNAIPNDPAKPFNPSGIRLGTPAITTRGMGKKEMIEIAKIMDEVITEKSEKRAKKARKEIKKLAEDFPLPYDL
ncbi:MAG: serine hydroxymethyltransferase [Patescibacteria group bacterium]